MLLADVFLPRGASASGWPALNVRYRDVRYSCGSVVQRWKFATP